MEKREYGVLGGKIGRIKCSNVDPVWLAERLKAADIIGKRDEDNAKRAYIPEDQRRVRLVELVQENVKRSTFPTLVNILLSEPRLKRLGEELRGK